jgi:tetratricopeptide (TPR) repeat protein
MILLLNLRVFPPGEIVHDRFMYFPSVGFSLLLALGLDWFASSSGLPVSIRARRVGIVAALGIVLGAATIHYCRFWANDWVLYARALSVAPGNKMAANNLAVDLADAGRYEEAAAIEQRVLARDPGYALAQYNLGYCQYRLGNFAEARTNLMRAVPLSPAEPEPYLYLGLTDYRMGLSVESVANVRHAVELSPENARYRFTLGLVLRTMGDVAAARYEFTTALALDPTLAAAIDQLKEIDQHAPPR